MRRWITLTFTHLATLAFGFALGVYLLPILTAPKGPAHSELTTAAAAAQYSGTFRRDLKGSDLIHWGEGEIRVGRERIAHIGRLSPGPDYKLYLAKRYVDTKDGFLAIKSESVRIADIKSFDGFIAAVPAGVNVDDYTAVVIWCEAFGQFITAARYK